jgi:hypothetical protein
MLFPLSATHVSYIVETRTPSSPCLDHQLCLPLFLFYVPSAQEQLHLRPSLSLVPPVSNFAFDYSPYTSGTAHKMRTKPLPIDTGHVSDPTALVPPARCRSLLRQTVHGVTQSRPRSLSCIGTTDINFEHYSMVDMPLEI